MHFACTVAVYAPYWPWTSAVFILSIQHCVQSCTTTTVSSTLLAMDFSCVHTVNTALCTVMYHYHCVQHPIGHGLQLCSYCQYSTVYSHVPLPLCPAPYWPWTSAVFILTIQHCVQSCTTTTVSSTLLAMDFSCVHTDNTALCTVMYHYHCVQHPIGHGLQLCSY